MATEWYSRPLTNAEYKNMFEKWKGDPFKWDERTLGPDSRCRWLTPKPVKCSICGGRGYTEYMQETHREFEVPDHIDRDTVKGKVTYNVETDECYRCNGTGTVWYSDHVHTPECFSIREYDIVVLEREEPVDHVHEFYIHGYRVDQDFYTEQMQISYAIQMIEEENEQ